jgi:hypothetical protein
MQYYLGERNLIPLYLLPHFQRVRVYLYLEVGRV